MADRTPLLLATDEDGSTLKPDEQMMIFQVWQKPEDEATSPVKIPLFRVRGSVAHFKYGKLSGVVIDVIRSMYHAFDVTKDVEAARRGIELKRVRAIRIEEGIANERTNFIAKHPITATPDHYSYKPEDMSGSFCYDPDKQTTAPIKAVNIEQFKQALHNQLGNKDTMGDASDGSIKYLWSPFEASGEMSSPEIEAYATNLDEFQTWTEKIVYWEYTAWEPEARR